MTLNEFKWIQVVRVARTTVFRTMAPASGALGCSAQWPCSVFAAPWRPISALLWLFRMGFSWFSEGFRGAAPRRVTHGAPAQLSRHRKSLSSRSNCLELAPFWEEKPRKSLGAVGARHLSHGAEAATTRVVPVPRRFNCRLGTKRGAGRHAQQRCHSF